MVTLPIQFVATKYPGYFWNLEDKRLYSMKVTGVLRPLKRILPNRWNQMWRYNSTGGYKVSVDGRRRWLLDEYLAELKPNVSEIPVQPA